jgi:hypothetical protein
VWFGLPRHDRPICTGADQPPGLSATSWLTATLSNSIDHPCRHVDPQCKLIVAEAGSHVATTVWGDAPSLAAVSLIEVEAAQRSRRHTVRSADVTTTWPSTSLDDLIEQLDIVEVDVDLIGRARELATRLRIAGLRRRALGRRNVGRRRRVYQRRLRTVRGCSQEGMLVANPLDR